MRRMNNGILRYDLDAARLFKGWGKKAEKQGLRPFSVADLYEMHIFPFGANLFASYDNPNEMFDLPAELDAAKEEKVAIFVDEKPVVLISGEWYEGPRKSEGAPIIIKPIEWKIDETCLGADNLLLDRYPFPQEIVMGEYVDAFVCKPGPDEDIETCPIKAARIIAADGDKRLAIECDGEKSEIKKCYVFKTRESAEKNRKRRGKDEFSFTELFWKIPFPDPSDFYRMVDK